MLSRVLHAEKRGITPAVVWPLVGGGMPAAAAPVQRFPQHTAELEQQVEHRIAEARQAGFLEGEAAARSRAEMQVQPLMERLTQALKELASARPALLRDAEAELVDLALAIAHRILRRQLAIDRDALQGLVKSALEKMQAQQICRVRVHPELSGALRHALERQGQGALEVVEDASLSFGGILLETARGNLDASLETQLEEIGVGLADRLPRP